MDRKIWQEAGYVRDNYGAQELDKLVWDDNYEIIPVGTVFDTEEEWYSTNDKKWRLEIRGKTPVYSSTCIFRRPKPGLVRVRVKEE